MQPRSELRVYPVDLSEFGTTPFGEDVYRVVWADSRKSVAYRGETKLVTDKYQHGAEGELRGKWILERWLPAAVYYGMTASKWEELQKVAPDQKRFTPAQDSEINRFLETLGPEMRTHVEAQLTPPQREPIIEPYSSEGEYEFAGLYFPEEVEPQYVREVIAAHMWRMRTTTQADREAERNEVDAAKEVASDKQFDTMFGEALEAANMAA